MSKIVIMESLGISKEELDTFKEPFEKEGHSFEVFEKSTDKDVLIKEAKDADVMIIANMPMPDEVIRECKSLKFIDVAFTGVDHVGLDAAKENDIKVSNASGYSNEAVSELVIGMAISIARNLRTVEDRCREGKGKDGLVGFELKGKTVGIVGLGKIGSRTAELFNAFGCRVLATSRTVHPNVPRYVAQVSLEELLKESDIVVLHCPANESTKGLINKDRLAVMKKSAVLINAARGAVVVTRDLADALNNGDIAAAGIDVFDKEPPLDLSEPLLNAKNCLVTPHVAFATKQSMTLRAEIVFDNLRAFFKGEQKNVIL